MPSTRLISLTITTPHSPLISFLTLSIPIIRPSSRSAAVLAFPAPPSPSGSIQGASRSPKPALLRRYCRRGLPRCRLAAPRRFAATSPGQPRGSCVRRSHLPIGHPPQARLTPLTRASAKSSNMCLVVLQGSYHGLFAALEPDVTQAVEELLLRVVRASIFRQRPLASAPRSLWVALHAQRGHGREHHLPHFQARKNKMAAVVLPLRCIILALNKSVQPTDKQNSMRRFAG